MRKAPSPKSMISESGDAITIAECRRCKKKNATGINFIRDGVSIFTCDSCGQNMRCGNVETISNTQKQYLDNLEKEKALKRRERGELAARIDEEVKDEITPTLTQAGFLFARHVD